MTFSHFDDQNIRDMHQNNRPYTEVSNNNNLIFSNDNMNSSNLEGGNGGNNYVQSTFHSMCSELPHST